MPEQAPDDLSFEEMQLQLWLKQIIYIKVR
jgi:hypothetical protein